jgi:hypothetical protein
MTTGNVRDERVMCACDAELGRYDADRSLAVLQAGPAYISRIPDVRSMPLVRSPSVAHDWRA